jgi:hypothetical protein
MSAILDPASKCICASMREVSPDCYWHGSSDQPMSEDEIETWLNVRLAQFVDFEPRVRVIRTVMGRFDLTPKRSAGVTSCKENPMTDPVATYHLVAGVLALHRRCFMPDGGAAFCSCNRWSHPDGDGLEWHEHAAQKVAWALDAQACTRNPLRHAQPH